MKTAIIILVVLIFNSASVNASIVEAFKESFYNSVDLSKKKLEEISTDSEIFILNQKIKEYYLMIGRNVVNDLKHNSKSLSVKTIKLNKELSMLIKKREFLIASSDYKINIPREKIYKEAEAKYMEEIKKLNLSFNSGLITKGKFKELLKKYRFYRDNAVEVFMIRKEFEFGFISQQEMKKKIDVLFKQYNVDYNQKGVF